ncbi:MAG: ABC transporter permease [Desulfobacterium sp.]|jgi:putative ABC transport system permease protein|nr:ABC transporter permease [Desulfobacterium sp.]
MIWNAFLLALGEIRRNLMRSLLTTLGIVIGVAAVIAMVTLGQGATSKVTSDIASLGRNLILVYPGTAKRGGGAALGAKPLKVKDAEAISREIAGAASVSATAMTTAPVIFGNENRPTTITGADNAYFAVREWEFHSGRPFSVAELQAGKPVCVLGWTVAKELFGHQTPLGAAIRLDKISCRVIGVLRSKGQSSLGSDQDDFAVIPLQTFHRRVSGNQDVHIIYVSAVSSGATEQVQGDIEALMGERRRLARSDQPDFQVKDMKEISDMVANATRVMTALLGAIAAISLVVGGIGIMNIMLVSVTERTREIGIRLAIGAMEREVLLQFLVEAVVLCLFGGLIGIITGLLITLGASHFLALPLVFNPAIIAVAFLFSAGVGVVFGFFPARKAARLDPIQALRHE